MTDYVVSRAGVAHRPDCPAVPLIVTPAVPTALARPCRVCLDPPTPVVVLHRSALGWPDTGRFTVGLRGRSIGDGSGVVVR